MERKEADGLKGFVRASDLEKHPILRVLDDRRRSLVDEREQIEDELTRIEPGDVGRLSDLLTEWRENELRRQAYYRVISDLRGRQDVLDELQRRVEA